MQAKQLSASLEKFAQLLKTAGCDHGAEELRGLAEVMALAGTTTIAATVKKIQRHWKSSERPSTYPASSKMHLQAAIEVLQTSKAAKGIIADYRSLLTLFDGTGDAQTSAFLADLREALKAAPKRNSAKKPAKSLDRSKMRAIADRLTDLLQNNAGFDAAVTELKTPRKYTNKELSAIAEYFLGYDGGHKTKAAIIKAIRTRQQQEAIGASKDRRIEKIAV